MIKNGKNILNSRTIARVFGIVKESIVDGPGLRFVVFFQGCLLKCRGCHNPLAQNLKGGNEKTVFEIVELIKKNPLLSGITLSGGEPFLQAKASYEIARFAKKENLNVITYTGYTMEELFKGLSDHSYWKELLEQTDILVDGPFIFSKKSLLLKFRGSSNQRIVDSKISLKKGKVITKKDF
ncbi:MAG: anaerobic ribonucleoside-triphosphate reductase activating protein [Oscillospiraceae bacterium]|jgi:anaerobic ribonucleoside-triphosphate reductase activating protein|nr:anaerobic ribonucleoside-triphosphate reductase activating protein [Oscillospiraceae bacterium]